MNPQPAPIAQHMHILFTARARRASTPYHIIGVALLAPKRCHYSSTNRVLINWIFNYFFFVLSYSILHLESDWSDSFTGLLIQPSTNFLWQDIKSTFATLHPGLNGNQDSYYSWIINIGGSSGRTPSMLLLMMMLIIIILLSLLLLLLALLLLLVILSSVKYHSHATSH